MNAALSRVDKTMESLFAGLKQRGVEDCVNIVIVSDHGMATYDPSKLVHLKEVNHCLRMYKHSLSPGLLM